MNKSQQKRPRKQRQGGKKNPKTYKLPHTAASAKDKKEPQQTAMLGERHLPPLKQNNISRQRVKASNMETQEATLNLALATTSADEEDLPSKHL